MNAIPTRPSAYTVAVSSHQNISGVAACSKPTTTPHNIGVRRARDGAGEVIAERDKVWRPSAMRVHPLVNARLDATAVRGRAVLGLCRGDARADLVKGHAGSDL